MTSSADGTRTVPDVAPRFRFPWGAVRFIAWVTCGGMLVWGLARVFTLGELVVYGGGLAFGASVVLAFRVGNYERRPGKIEAAHQELEWVEAVDRARARMGRRGRLRPLVDDEGRPLPSSSWSPSDG